MSINRMFALSTERSNQEGECLQLTNDDQTMLWHQRYGHLNFQGLNTLKNKDMVVGLPSFSKQDITCTDCLNGKQTRQPIPKQSSWRASKVKGWVYLLLNKSEALNYFKEFKTMAEKESSEVVKCLRTDRGGEYVSSEFINFCKEQGIKRQLTTAYTPQQNGVAERRNRTIMNMVRSMLIAKEVPKCLWTEAVMWAVYLLNKCPCTKNTQKQIG
ncbi:hypothetical protein LIER_04701 [Lithospermum erythrorhizon]|uniref:Integrase catalytic domain-containing protein n=1 Tax=Lithospermum erythrorhizon TaxID=34254 RepID=A0AAV3NXX7_LITER